MTEFKQLFPWSLEPVRPRVDRKAAQERAETYREHFRFVRAQRQAEFCPPWVLGQELGWYVLSPIDATLTPLPQTEIAAGESAEDGLRAAGMSELWVRDGAAIAVNRASWLHLYQFKGQADKWENMFLPNGMGSVEWRQGWTVSVPDGHSLLILPVEEAATLGVKIGILTSAALRRMADSAGFSLPIEPTAPTTVRRGDPVARVVVLHPDSLKGEKALSPRSACQRRGASP